MCILTIDLWVNILSQILHNEMSDLHLINVFSSSGFAVGYSVTKFTCLNVGFVLLVGLLELLETLDIFICRQMPCILSRIN